MNARLQAMFDVAQAQYNRQMPPEELCSDEDELCSDEDEMLDAADRENDIANTEPRERIFDAER